MSDPTRPAARATATDDSVEPQGGAGQSRRRSGFGVPRLSRSSAKGTTPARRRPDRDDAVLPVHPWLVWLVAVLLLAGTILLLAGLTWTGAAVVASGVLCVVAMIVRARRSDS